MPTKDSLSVSRLQVFERGACLRTLLMAGNKYYPSTQTRKRRTLSVAFSKRIHGVSGYGNGGGMTF